MEGGKSQVLVSGETMLDWGAVVCWLSEERLSLFRAIFELIVWLAEGWCTGGFSAVVQGRQLHGRSSLEGVIGGSVVVVVDGEAGLGQEACAGVLALVSPTD